MDLGALIFKTDQDDKWRTAAHIETFVGFQAGFLSSEVKDFYRFQWIAGLLAVWLAARLARWLAGSLNFWACWAC